MEAERHTGNQGKCFAVGWGSTHTPPYLVDVYKQHNAAFSRLKLHTERLLRLQFGNVHSHKTCKWLGGNYIKNRLDFKTPLLNTLY